MSVTQIRENTNMPVLDQNQNQNQSVAGAVERRFRARYNSDVESRLANVAAPDTLVPI